MLESVFSNSGALVAHCGLNVRRQPIESGQRAFHKGTVKRIRQPERIRLLPHFFNLLLIRKRVPRIIQTAYEANLVDQRFAGKQLHLLTSSTCQWELTSSSLSIVITMVILA